MATRALNRTVLAVLLLAALLAALLGAWWATGWREVRTKQAASRAAPEQAAADRAGELARDLRGELEGLIAREVNRPYFQYQNLFHDPKASAGKSVTPSPLASGSDDPLVLGYFQIDANARVTTPTINDDFPNLSEPKRIAEHRAFRDAVSRELAHTLAPEATKGPLIAQVDPPRHRPLAPTPHVTAQTPQVPGNTVQTIHIDPSSYAQNSCSNSVYWQAENNINTSGCTPIKTMPEVATTNVDTAPGNVAPPPQQVRVAPPPEPPRTITITVSPLEWRTLTFAGAPALLGVRQVQTPDGSFTQGFIVDRATLTSTLAARAGDLVAQLSPSGGAGANTVEVVPGWQLGVAPNPRALASALADGDAIANAFITRFAMVGSIALVAAMLVVLLVSRAERTARERSQFAAAAAHELRTPLAGLQLYGDMLADGLGDPGKLRDYARRMSEEASRLGRVVSNVLGFSQLERGNLSVDPKSDAVDVALRELAERAEPALDRAGAALELDVPDGLRARFDRDGLARIVANLLDNAEKYARGADDRTIRLAAADTGDAVEVVVSDHGPGVSDRARLFRPFSRGVASDGPAGLGLGLALSRSLARAMGGELAYRTPAAGGAAFVVTLQKTT
jgi:signal transduction histidine kinase